MSALPDDETLLPRQPGRGEREFGRASVRSRISLFLLIFSAELCRHRGGETEYKCNIYLLSESPS